MGVHRATRFGKWLQDCDLVDKYMEAMGIKKRAPFGSLELIEAEDYIKELQSRFTEFDEKDIVPDTATRIEQIEKEIESLNLEKKELQEKCPHTDTHIVKYSWRVGVIEDAEVCKDCNKFIKYINETTYSYDYLPTEDS